MASKSWNPFGVSLSITATVASVTRTSATKYSVKFNVSWKTTSSGNKTDYGMKASSGGGSKTLNSQGTKASSGSGSFTGSYSITGNGSASKTVTVKFTNYNDWHDDSASKSIDLVVSVPAWTSYKVTYNANGGSGAPSAQTKWKDQTLTLSSTKPTRTGYTFQGWATSASGAVAYKSSASYTGNAALTLYAVWKINTWTVSYNVNGGSGAPGNQTKTYGKTLVLSTTKPTRTGYDFKGWGTSATDTSVDYAAGANYTANAAITLYAIWELKQYIVAYNANGGTGGPGIQTKTYDVVLALTLSTPTKTDYIFKGWTTSASSTSVIYKPGSIYTANANITLYAVWELAYKKPRIKHFSVDRCDSSGNIVDEGTCALVNLSWETDFPATSIVFSYKQSTSEIWEFYTYDKSGGLGTIDEHKIILDDVEFPTDYTYDFKVKVSDSNGNSTKELVLPGITFTIDMLGGGRGVSFGKPAELEDVADFEFEAYFRNGIRPLILSDNTDLNEVKTPNTYAGNAATTAGYLNCPITTGTSFTLEVLPAGGDGQIMQRITSCSKTGLKVYVRHYYSDAWGDWVTI